MLCDRVAGYMQAYTLYSHIRPFGASVIVGALEDGKPLLFMIEPSGVSWVCAHRYGKIADSWSRKLTLGGGGQFSLRPRLRYI